MKKYFSYLFVWLLTAFCACQNNDFEGYNNANEVIVTANIASSTNTRVTLTPTVNDEGNPIVKVAWKSDGESFRVRGANENMVLGDYQTFTQLADNKFSGMLPETTNQNYWATYPANDNVWATNSPFLPVSYNEDLFTTQNGKLSEERTVMYVWTVANEEVPKFNFDHLTTLLKPNFKIGEEELTANVISSIIFKDMLIESGNADFKIDCTSHQEGDEIYVYLPEVGFSAYGNSEYIDIYKSIIDVVVNTKDGKIYEGRINIPLNVILDAGKLYTATISLDLSPYFWTNEVAASQEVVGSGSSESPYLISTAADLQWFVENVATKNGEESISKDMYYKLMHDLVISSSVDKPWIAIGDEYTKFQGIFDGNEYTISGSLVSAYSGNNSFGDDVNFGFFGYLGEFATVKNLHLNLNVKGGNTKNERRSAEHSNTGILAGMNGGLITDCMIQGVVQGGRATEDVNISHTGGVVGYNLKDMKNCINRATVNGGIGTNCHTGGIAGRFGDYYNQNGLMNNCINYGTVTGGDIWGSDTGGTGGITGYRHYYGTMEKCINNGSITAASGNSDTGGVVGRLDQAPSICSCNIDNSNSGLPIIGTEGEGKRPIECVCE